MKDKKEEFFLDNETYEFELQKIRIKKILQNTIHKLKVLSHLPTVLEDDGKILRQFLNKTEADFIVLVCQEHNPFTRGIIENRSDLEMICNMLERIRFYEKKSASTMRKVKSFQAVDQSDIHVAYAVDLIFKCKPLVDFMEAIEEQPESLMAAFIDAMMQLEKIVFDRLSISASEEIKRENDLTTAYRLSMMLSNTIQELEELLEKQREELGKEHDRKEAIVLVLAEKIEDLKMKCENDINRIIYESEVSMMKDYNKSIERQAELSEEAIEATREYEKLLEDHLAEEKTLRIKRLKIETQLASWIAKYDTDIGEKQAEYDELEATYNHEKEELDALQEKFDIQEEEYLILMQEKEEEEHRIMEEKAWIFLQNRSARRIQRAWRAYRARKLARKKARKSKKKGGKAEGSAGDKKGAKEDKEVLPSDADPNALLKGKFSEAVLGEIKSKETFSKHDLVVDLMDQE